MIFLNDALAATMKQMNQSIYVKNSSGDYIIPLVLKLNSQTSASASSGTVIGSLYLEPGTTLSSNGVSYYAGAVLPSTFWAMSVVPSASATSYSSSVCETNISGVGIRYYNADGSAVECSAGSTAAGDIVEKIYCNNSNSSASFKCSSTNTFSLSSNQKIADIIVSGDTLPDAGYYTLEVSPAFSAYWHGVTNTTGWGTAGIRGNPVIRIATNDSSIYFPAFPHSDPLVSLNLDFHPGSSAIQSTVSGSKKIDMCLYDGKDGYASSASLLFLDKTSSESRRSSNFFSVYKVGSDNTLDENRIDYEVSITNPYTGEKQQVKNNVDILWSGTSQRSKQRIIVIDGVQTWCSPTTITLTTPEFNVSSKSSGYYTGTLSVVFTPATSSS